MDTWLLVLFSLLIVAIPVIILLRKRQNGCKRLTEGEEETRKVPEGMSRELSRLERGFKYVTDVSIGLIGCKVVLRSDTELTEDFFRLMVQNVWNFAPLLRMNIIEGPDSKKGKKHFYFREMTEVAFDEIIQWRKLEEGKSLFDELESEICISFNTDREPLWRVIVYDFPQDDNNNNQNAQFKKGQLLP